jgi:hypothetical protein
MTGAALLIAVIVVGTVLANWLGKSGGDGPDSVDFDSHDSHDSSSHDSSDHSDFGSDHGGD